MEGHASDPFGDEREYHVSAVGVGEPFAGPELRRVPVEDREVLLRVRELVHGYRQDVVRDLVVGVFVEVVADA